MSSDLPLESHISALTSDLLDEYVKLKRSADWKADVHSEALSGVCALVGRRYPTAFDNAVQRKLAQLKSQRSTTAAAAASAAATDSKSVAPTASAEAASAAYDTLNALLNEALAGTRHQLMSQSGTTLHSSLQHSSSRVRVLALDKLEQLLLQGVVGVEYASDVLLSGLTGDQPKVLKRVLDIDSLPDVVPHAVLFSRVFALLNDASATLRAFALHPSSASLPAQAKDARSVIPSVLQFLCSAEVQPKLSDAQRNAACAALFEHMVCAALFCSVSADVLTSFCLFVFCCMLGRWCALTLPKSLPKCCKPLPPANPLCPHSSTAHTKRWN